MSTFTLQNIGTIQMTDVANTVSGACITPVSGGVSVDGYIVATGGVSAGNIQISSSQIKTAGNSAGDIDFTNDNLSTTGSVDFSGGVSLSGGTGVSINGYTYPTSLGTSQFLYYINDTIGVSGYGLSASGNITLTYGETDVTISSSGSGGASGATEINELTDAFANTTNVVLGVSPQSISGSDNVGVGVSALDAITTGNRNIALGSDALISGTTTSDNIAIGYGSLVTLSTGNQAQNVAIGTSTLSAMTGFSADGRNVAIGYLAGQNIIGGQNTIVGASAGVFLSTGDNNLILGHGAGPSGTSSSNDVYLGNAAMNNLYFSGNIIATSDARDKTDVEDSVYGVEFIDRLRPVEYTWNRRHLQSGDDNNNINGKRRVGLIAQELLEIMPNNENEVLNLVNEDNPERYHVGYNNLIPILVKAVKDLKAEVDTLKQRMDNCSC